MAGNGDKPSAIIFGALPLLSSLDPLPICHRWPQHLFPRPRRLPGPSRRSPSRLGMCPALDPSSSLKYRVSTCASWTSFPCPLPQRESLFSTCNTRLTHPLSYLGAEFPDVLSRPDVEYRQANLTVPSRSPVVWDNIRLNTPQPLLPLPLIHCRERPPFLMYSISPERLTMTVETSYVAFPPVCLLLLITLHPRLPSS